MFFKVSSTKGVMKFGRKGKLSPWYIGPFQITGHVNDGNAYILELPPHLAEVYNVFHVSKLKKDEPNLSHVIDYEPIHIKDEFSYEEKPVAILETQEKVLRTRTVCLVKVLWEHHNQSKTIEETDKEVKKKYPYLFTEVCF